MSKRWYPIFNFLILSVFLISFNALSESAIEANKPDDIVCENVDIRFSSSERMTISSVKIIESDHRFQSYFPAFDSDLTFHSLKLNNITFKQNVIVFNTVRLSKNPTMVHLSVICDGHEIIGTSAQAQDGNFSLSQGFGYSNTHIWSLIKN